MGSLLLSRLGVRSLVVDLRGRTSTHPRSRLLDAPSVELMREVGVEQQVIDTGPRPRLDRVQPLVRLSGGRGDLPGAHAVLPLDPDRPEFVHARDDGAGLRRGDPLRQGPGRPERRPPPSTRRRAPSPRTTPPSPARSETTVAVARLLSSPSSRSAPTASEVRRAPRSEPPWKRTSWTCSSRDVIFEADFTKHTSDPAGRPALHRPPDGRRRLPAARRRPALALPNRWIRSHTGDDRGVRRELDPVGTRARTIRSPSTCGR